MAHPVRDKVNVVEADVDRRGVGGHEGRPIGPVAVHVRVEGVQRVGAADVEVLRHKEVVEARNLRFGWRGRLQPRGGARRGAAGRGGARRPACAPAQLWRGDALGAASRAESARTRAAAHSNGASREFATRGRNAGLQRGVPTRRPNAGSQHSALLPRGCLRTRRRGRGAEPARRRLSTGCSPPRAGTPGAERSPAPGRSAGTQRPRRRGPPRGWQRAGRAGGGGVRGPRL